MKKAPAPTKSKLSLALQTSKSSSSANGTKIFSTKSIKKKPDSGVGSHVSIQSDSGPQSDSDLDSDSSISSCDERNEESLKDYRPGGYHPAFKERPL
nr:BPK_HP1_G0043750.mRNA.1.CDS.1 [Saccharomyces cerevisiae]